MRLADKRMEFGLPWPTKLFTVDVRNSALAHAALGEREDAEQKTHSEPSARIHETEILVLGSIWAFQTIETGNNARVKSLSTPIVMTRYVGINAIALPLHVPPTWG